MPTLSKPLKNFWGGVNLIPYSPCLLMSLQQRILDALQAIQELNPTDSQINQRIQDTQTQIEHLKTSQTGQATANFVVPHEDAGIKILRDLIKELRNVVQIEHKKGRIPSQAFQEEDERLKHLYLRISIENIFHHVHEAKMNKDVNSARALLEQAQRIVSAHQGQYATTTMEQIEQMLLDLQSLNKEQVTRMHPKYRDNDVNEIFAPKKKW